MIIISIFGRGPSCWSKFSSKVVNLVPNRFLLSSSSCWRQLPKSTIISLHSSSFEVRSTGYLLQIRSNNFSTMSKPILYSYFRSSASWRVRILLAHKGIEFEYQPVNLLQNGQVSEDYLKVNPLGQVPSLVYDGKTITQSIAILGFLEDIFPQIPMLPKDPFTKAKVLQICEMINAGIQPLQNPPVLAKSSGDDPVKRIEWANYWITKGFVALEKVLSESSGKYCIGDELTWADCCLAPQVHQALRFKVDVETYPNIFRINKTLSELDAFQKAHAFVQVDCPAELRQK